MFNKKAAFPLLKEILMLMVSVFFLASVGVNLLQASEMPIDDKKTQTQLVVNKIFYSSCFSDDFATIEETKFNEETLNKCFKNVDSDLLFRVKLKGKSFYLYLKNSEEMFNTKKVLCENSNLLCTPLVYPVTYIDENGNFFSEKMIVEIISS